MTLYHLIHRPFVGTTLFPLNRLREREPALYEGQREKYKGREHLLGRKLSSLDCFWNDVLHWSAVPPTVLYAALEEAGYPQSRRRSPYFFVIEPDNLEPEKTIFFHPNTEQEESYDSHKVPQYSELPDSMRTYFQTELAQNRRPFLWNHITHILYKGIIDVTNLPIVDRRGMPLEDRMKLFEEARK